MCVVSPEYRQLYDLASDSVEFVWRIYVGRTSIEIAEYIREMLAEKGVEPSQFKIIFMSNVQGHLCVAKQERKRMPSKRNTCCFVRQRLRTRTMVMSRTWETRKWVRKFDRKNHSVMVLTSGEDDARIRQEPLPCSGAHLH